MKKKRNEIETIVHEGEITDAIQLLESGEIEDVVLVFIYKTTGRLDVCSTANFAESLGMLDLGMAHLRNLSEED